MMRPLLYRKLLYKILDRVGTGNFSIHGRLEPEQVVVYKLRQTIDYIQSNLSEKLSLKTMAERVDMGVYYFASQFKQAMGISPYQYAIQQRLAFAKGLLRQKKRSLSQIALDCGFTSQSHFNRVFHKHVGTTPKKYQQEY